jgi:hypothetical protein
MSMQKGFHKSLKRQIIGLPNIAVFLPLPFPSIWESDFI